jgi:hypothetical protein
MTPSASGALAPKRPGAGWAVAYRVGLALAIGLVITGITSPQIDSASPAVFYSVWAISSFVPLVLLFLATDRTNRMDRRRLRAMSDAAPGEFVFVWAQPSGFTASLLELGANVALNESRLDMAASAGMQGLTLYRADTMAVVLRLAWHEIRAITPTSTRTFKFTLTTIDLELVRANKNLALQLNYPRSAGATLSRLQDAEWITERLRAVRQASSTS